MMLASDKQYVKNKTRMRDNLRRQESGSIRNNSGKMRNIPSRSSMGPSIVRDDSDEDDIIPVSRSRRTSRSCDLTKKTSPSVDKKLKVRTTSQSQDFSIVQNVTPSPGKQYAAQMARKRRQSFRTSTPSPLGKVLNNSNKNTASDVLLIENNKPSGKREVIVKSENKIVIQEKDEKEKKEKEKKPAVIIKKKVKKIGVPDGWYSGVGGTMGLNVRVETEMYEKNDTEELSSVFVRSINQTIFEDRAINDIKYKIGAMDNKGCKKVEWDQKLMDGLKGSVVSQIDGEYNTKKNIISLAIWIKIGWMPAVALYATMKSVPAAIGPY